ncbi:MAG: phosphocarrier protein HPr [Elusimicrobia bacterium GWA2_56_46]|nr:MAG: phosphocarrier protein HPr [Elusimicrobia bacterium GWA2_56_46]OGR56169.1 MAG: phosphocarrier protein HPr [Elusimicrobia bacterium GWC2_56_31]HBB67357.1 phosphocarrier protein HPr [Elusimicrobiota bacterium]HBW23055.1 phosphocarrier protein HPr [Elusimicrobiota bacterium]
MIKKDIKIINELGIHARPAGMIANTSARFVCDLKLIKDKMEVNAKSIMGVMTLAAGKGSVITIVAHGTDEVQALEAVSKLFRDKFDEE